MKSGRASFWVTLRKELLDGIRDRRSILAALVPLAMIPAMLLFGFDRASDEMERVRNIKVPVTGGDRAAPLIDWLDRQSGVDIADGPDDPREAVRKGEVGLALVIPEDFAERFDRSKTAKVEVVVDSSNSRNRRTADRLRSLLRAYAQQLAAQRLVARGVSPEVIRPIRVASVDLATDRERMAPAFAFLPMVLLITVFVGGLQIAIDSTAGERERGSLEPLLINPVSLLSFVGGKWGASVVFAWACALLATGMLLAVLEYSPLQRVGLDLDLGPPEITRILAAALPLAPLASGLQMSVATLARSYKEAQTYVSFLMFVPMAPLMFSIGAPVERALWKLAVPVLGQHVLITSALEGKPFAPLDFFVAAAAALAAAAVFVYLTARLFRREAIVFGR